MLRVAIFAVGLAALGVFLILVGTPAEAVALLLVFAAAVAAIQVAITDVDECPETLLPGDRAPAEHRAVDDDQVPFDPALPPTMSAILNPHPDNRRRRASGAERDLVVWELAWHYTRERLTDSEFDSRHDKARKSDTRGDLADLLEDLPRLRHHLRS